MNDIPLNATSEMAMFADGTVIFVQKPQRKTAITTIQSVITELRHWYTKWGITLNRTQCETKIFTLKKIHDPSLILYI